MTLLEPLVHKNIALAIAERFQSRFAIGSMEWKIAGAILIRLEFEPLCEQDSRKALALIETMHAQDMARMSAMRKSAQTRVAPPIPRYV